MWMCGTALHGGGAGPNYTVLVWVSTALCTSGAAPHRGCMGLWHCGCVVLQSAVASRDCFALRLLVTALLCGGSARHCGSAGLICTVAVWDSTALLRCGTALHYGSVGPRCSVAARYYTPLWQCGTELR